MSRPLLDTVEASAAAKDGVVPLSSPREGRGETRLRPVACARWWVLLVYCCIAMAQSCTWNVFSPIYPAVYKAFPSWTSFYLSWVINSANISFGLSLIPVAHAVKRFGVRNITIYCSVMVFLGAGLRCIPISDGTPQRTLMVVSMLCNGAGGAWLNFGAPVLSELWFPASERTMATAIASVATYAGAALGFVVGPLIVGTPQSQASAHEAVRKLFFIEASFCAVCVVSCLVYYPDRPEHAPSEAAAAKRLDEHNGRLDAIVGGNELGSTFDITSDHIDQNEGGSGGTFSNYFCYPRSRRYKRYQAKDELNYGALDLYERSTTHVENLDTTTISALKKYWILAISMGIPLGVYQGWNSTLFTCVRALDITQDEAAWLGFFMTMSGCAGSVLVGAILDKFAGRLKAVTEILMLIALACFTLFSANAASLLPLSHSTSVTVAYATGIIGGMALNISVPLFFEMIMETVYGWGDEGVGSMLTILINTIVQIVFLIVLAGADPKSSNLWTSWTNAASLALCFLVLLFLRVEYRRLSIDEGTPLSKTGVWFDRSLGCY